MHINNDKNDKIEICQNLDLYFHIRENTMFVFTARFNGWGKSLFAPTYIETVLFQSYAMTFSRMVPPT